MIRRKVTTCYVEFLSKQQVDEGLPCKGFTAQKYGYIATILFVEPQIVFLKQRFLLSIGRLSRQQTCGRVTCQPSCLRLASLYLVCKHTVDSCAVSIFVHSVCHGVELWWSAQLASSCPEGRADEFNGTKLAL